MDDHTSQEVETPEPPRDLREELAQNLSTQFAAELTSNGSLPSSAQEALVELLHSEASSATEIIAAASKNDPEEEEAGNE